MLPRRPVPEGRWPRVVAGTFLVLLGFHVVDAVGAIAAGQRLTRDFFVGSLTTLPFIVLIGYAARRLATGAIPAHRHRRIALWMVGGLVAFLCINLLVMTIFPTQPPIAYLGWVRWAAALGGGTGVLIGTFEARAIDREVSAERERVKNERLVAQNDRLEEVATILAHDIRNPLNVASGHIELASREHESASLDTAQMALSRMDEIIEQTLVLARSGRVIGDLETVDLAALARRCWQNVDMAGAHLDVVDPPTVSADGDRLQHLFENLFRNAVEHGSTNLVVRVLASDDGFAIEDTGPGIPATDREHVFDAGYTTAADGNGFGLAIVREIADAHGWTTTLVGSDTGGTRIEFGDVAVLD